MTNNRMDILKGMVAQNPKDSFARYGLATEYKNAGNLEQAVTEYRDLMEVNPDYAAAYFHCGQTLEKLGLLEDARAVYSRGVEVTTRTGDAHTRSELEAALDILG